MSLLKIAVSRKVTATITIESDTAEMLDRYAAFTSAPADNVIDEALRHIFKIDKSFQAYLADARNSGRKPSAGLRTKKPSTPGQVASAMAAD